MKQFILSLATICLYNVSYPQVPDAGSILSSHNKESQQYTFESDEHEGLIAISPPPASDQTDSEVSVFIREFEIIGNPQLFPKTQLLGKLDSFLSKNLTLRELNQALSVINNSYHELGYFLSYAYFPQQDITEGKVQIEIREGRLDSTSSGIEVKRESKRLNSNRIIDVVSNANQPGFPLNRDNLERAMLILGDFPGLKASVTLAEGTEYATTKLIIETDEASLFHPWFEVSNTGNRYTGSTLGEAGLTFKNLALFGDRFTTSWKKSINEEGFDLGVVDYSLMANDSGLRVGFKGTWMEYELGKTFEILNARGTVSAFSLYGDYPIIRKTKLNLRTHVAYNFSLYEDESLGIQINEKQIQSLQTGMSFDETDRFGLGGFTYAHAFFKIGNNRIQNEASRTIDQGPMGPDTHGSFQKVSFLLKRIQRLPGSFLLSGKISGQWSSTNLDSSEKLHIGGIYGVRAYSASEGVGDSGVNLSLGTERILFKSSYLGEIRAKVFYDAGRIKQFTDGDSIPLLTPMTYNLSGWGFGLSFKDADRFHLDLIYARRNGDNPAANPSTGNDADGTQTKNRIWFTFQYHF